MGIGSIAAVFHPDFRHSQLILSGRILQIIVLALGLSGCVAKPPANPAMGPERLPLSHVVQQDETLYRIAQRYGLDWRELASRNQIAAPYLIFPGQRIALTGLQVSSSASTDVRSVPRASPPTAAPRPPAAAVQRPPAATPSPPTAAVQRPPAATPSPPAAVAQRPPATTPSPPAAAAQRPPATTQRPAPSSSSATPVAEEWQWPADGAVVRPFSTSSVSRRGIGIAGSRGDPVRAAAAGEVVYAGSGLVGYGRLIIIQHSSRLISAYGHNEELLVTEGEKVHAGQRIARIGDSGADRTILHFEIRVDGTPVDPNRYLPRR